MLPKQILEKNRISLVCAMKEKFINKDSTFYVKATFDSLSYRAFHALKRMQHKDYSQQMKRKNLLDKAISAYVRTSPENANEKMAMDIMLLRLEERIFKMIADNSYSNEVDKLKLVQIEIVCISNQIKEIE